MRVLAFGDSITQGFWDAEGGWVGRLRSDWDEQTIDSGQYDSPVIFNLGISGETTDGLLKRFQNETEARLFPDEEMAFVIATGTNDTVFRGNDNESEPEAYAAQIVELIDMAREHSSKIMFIGLLPVVDKLVNPIPWSTTGKCHSTERIRLFEAALKQVCVSKGVPVVDVFSAFVGADLDSLLIDGLHPNAEGHAVMTSLIKTQLERLLGISG